MDCPSGNVETAVEVGVTFHELPRLDCDELRNYTPDDVETVTMEDSTPFGEKIVSANTKGFPNFTANKAASKSGPMALIRRSLASEVYLSAVFRLDHVADSPFTTVTAVLKLP